MSRNLLILPRKKSFYLAQAPRRLPLSLSDPHVDLNSRSPRRSRVPLGSGRDCATKWKRPASVEFYSPFTPFSPFPKSALSLFSNKFVLPRERPHPSSPPPLFFSFPFRIEDFLVISDNGHDPTSTSLGTFSPPTPGFHVLITRDKLLPCSEIILFVCPFPIFKGEGISSALSLFIAYSPPPSPSAWQRWPFN